MNSTNLDSRAGAQQRADDIRTFRGELQRLQEDGVLRLSREQHEQLRQYHDKLLASLAERFDIDRDARAGQLSLGMRIASFIGALALAASAFFMFYRFWGHFGEAAQVAILLGSALASFGATIWINGRESCGYFTKLAAMVAFACYVLNLAMLGQIFNITPSDKALLAWAAYALLLAYLCDMRLLLAAGILCLAAFIAARTGTWSGMVWIHFGERPENFLLPALALFLLPQFVRHERYGGFAGTYRLMAMLLFFLPVLVLANWGRLSYLELDRHTVQGIYQVLGFAAAAGAAWLGTRRRWPEVVNAGVTFFTIFLYTKFFDWWWTSMPKYLFFLVLGLSAILLLLVFRRLRAAGAAPEGEAA
jgi:hypothetical protein